MPKRRAVPSSETPEFHRETLTLRNTICIKFLYRNPDSDGSFPKMAIFRIRTFFQYPRTAKTGNYLITFFRINTIFTLWVLI
jgi:hypothetical protein